MKFAIMGAGGVGGYFGGLLAKSGHEVALIARGDHLKALQNNGLTVKSFHGDFHMNLQAVENPNEIGKVDVVLFTPKAFDTESASKSLLPILKEDSVVVNLQNGVDNEEKMANILGTNRVLGGVTYIETTIEEPGVISQKSKNRDIIFGELNGEITERAKNLEKVFKDAEIPTILSDNIQRDNWKKFLFLSSFSAITSITGFEAGIVMEDSKTNELFRKLLNETYTLAKALNIPLTQEDLDNAYQFGHKIGKTTKSSLQRDLEREKRLEVDSLSGAVVRIGQELNIETPYHEMVYGVLKLKEKTYLNN